MSSFRLLIPLVAYSVVAGTPSLLAAQEFEVSGTVFYFYHYVPISEAQVRLKGSDRVVQASPTGIFQIAARSPADTLVVSALGFKSQEVPISGRNSLEVRLEGMPLYVVDGIMADSAAFNRLSPAEIESIRLLRDASAMSQYGLAGRGGVILVTTKAPVEPVQ
jgi:TonB-dependent SusC/RagA subfamily outer membrane receptor